MKNKSLKHLLRCLLPLCAALTLATPSRAQSDPTKESSAAQTPAPRMGEATHSLLQRQREGREASTTPRPIDGHVAELSQQRYLKSFEQPLPSWFDSRLKGK